MEKNAEKKEKGWTIVYVPWESLEGRPRVAGRFKTTKEKDEYMEVVQTRLLPEELETISLINDYNYHLPY